MKNCILVASILFLFINVNGQNPHLTYQNGIKVYNMSSYEEYTNSSSSGSSSLFYTEKTNVLNILHPTVAYQWNTGNNNFNELELTNFSINKTNKSLSINDTSGNGTIIGGNETLSSNISFTYEYIINYRKKKDKSLVPSLGFAVNPGFKSGEFNSTSSTVFPNNFWTVGVKGFIVPRLSYYFSPRLFMDVNLLLNVISNDHSINKVEDPSLPESHWKTTTINFNTFSRMYSGRVGLGIKL